MTLFVVGYDLKSSKGETRDYGPIEEALGELDSCHTQDSVWYVDRAGSASDLLDHLKPNFEDRDLLMVVKFTERPRYTKAKTGTNDWIVEHFG